MSKQAKRILVLGSGGSGKTTFALRLAEKTKLPVVHLDAHYWRPNWTPPSDKKTWESQVQALVQAEDWIMEGNYSGSLHLRLPRTDVVYFFDIPNWCCLWNILKRRWLFGGKTRPDIAPGCLEKIDYEFVMWVIRYPWRSKPKIFEVLAECKKSETQVVVFKSYKAVEQFFAERYS